jgi:tetratricopeptide (TPR) repeat protein
MVYGSSIYDLAGISKKTAQKLQDLLKTWGIEENQTGFLCYNAIRCVHLFHQGQWDVNLIPDEVIEKSIRIGNAFEATTAAFFIGMRCVDTGNEKNIQRIFDWLKKIESVVDFNYTFDSRIRLSCIHHAWRKEYAEIVKIVDENLERVKASDNEGILLNIYFFLTQAYIGLNEHQKAQETFNKVESIIDRHKKLQIFLTNYLITKIEFGLYKISLQDKENKDSSSAVRELLKTAEALIRKSRKNPSTMCRAYHLKSILLMRLNKDRQALRTLAQAVEAGEKYDLRPDLARVFFEMGKFLLDPGKKQNKVNNLSGRDYLQKARVMFEEMELRRDLEEYEGYVGRE